jgi:hypothetical protein
MPIAAILKIMLISIKKPFHKFLGYSAPAKFTIFGGAASLPAILSATTYIIAAFPLLR